MLEFIFSLQIALGYLISKIGKVVINKILPLFVRIFRCSEMLSVCADPLCEYKTALWICRMTNYSFKRINAGRHILIFYINICSGKMYTTGINYTKNGILLVRKRGIIKREWVLIITEWLCHHCRIWAISYTDDVHRNNISY